MKLIPIRITAAQHDAARLKAESDGRTFSGYVRNLIRVDLTPVGALATMRKLAPKTLPAKCWPISNRKP